nr:hypothetical protein [uncultured Enterobacter sp.]DAI87010.1 MAG TPA: hypothetical protein [Caudoviricetes sp.]
MREQFEAWMTSEQGFHGSDFKWDEHRNCYSEFGIHIAYKAYLAATASMQSERDQLAAQLADVVAENAGLKGAFDKPQAYLSWHAIPPTWEDPLPCGEYLDVHDEAGHKNSDGTDCWPVYAKPEIETPATDAFLAEVRAAAVDEVCLKISNAIVNCYQDEQVGLDAAATICGDFAAQLRNEVKV